MSVTLQLILHVLHHTGRDTGLRQQVHHLVRIAGAGPFPDQAVQFGGIHTACAGIGEARIANPVRSPEQGAEALPLGFIGHRDHTPAILPATGIAALRRVAQRAVAEAPRLASVHQGLEHQVSE